MGLSEEKIMLDAFDGLVGLVREGALSAKMWLSIIHAERGMFG